MAQDVTIKSTNGSMIAAMASGSQEDLGYKSGGFATWQHEQLCMVLTTSDGKALTPNGQLDNPANNLYADGNGHIQVCKGDGFGYVSLSLPSGYRFTSYEIVFSKPGRTTKGTGNNSITFNKANRVSTFGETGSDFGTYVTSASAARGGATATISRAEGAGGSMGNVLYFKLGPSSNDDNSLELITLESAKFYFTSEENYTPVTPAGEITSPVSAVDIPFSTSRVDYGRITQTTYYGNSRITYTSANVHDIPAYFNLYEAESVKDGADIDGIQGKVVDYKSGTISSAGGFFKLGRENQEQVYYIESPTYITLSDNTKSPIGYRIIEAKYEYTTFASNSFYIQYTYNGTKYYLNTNGRFTTTPIIWEIDEDGFISSNGLYLYWNNGNAATQSAKPTETGVFSIADNGRIYMTDYPRYYIRFYPYNNTYYGLITNNNLGYYATTEDVASGSTDGFKLYVYDQNGVNPEEITVTGYGTKTLTGLNNDAVKFGVKGIGLVRATLTLQALDPYLDKMAVVCQDQNPQKPIRLSQTFTAGDFSVSGGEFYFYMPKDCEGDNVAITFENLESKYFDETYTGGSNKHTSRINFVKSAHYNAFGNAHPNVIYTDRAEAASATPLERLKVGTVGTKPFKFNNADEVGTNGGTLVEYPFSLQKYANAPNNGEFESMVLPVTTEDVARTRYVFTTDETRYNIAPTTATQHRAYAFYEMIVHVQTHTYEPKVKFEKVYDKTLYRDKDGNVKTNSFYGAKVTAYDGNTPPKPGYSSTAAIFDVIDKAIKRGSDDFGREFPDLKGPDQLLYLDFSEMAGIYQTTTDTHGSMEDFAATNAPNCLIFIPVGASAPNNNVAYKETETSNTFRAAQNIVLTDMQPFYSPYDVQVDPAKEVKYERKITKSNYGEVKKASLIMPFVVEVDGGVHTNVDGSKITLHTMQNGAALTLIDGTTYAYFPELSNARVTEANKPYMVSVGNNTAENGSFIVSQKGTLIKACPVVGTDAFTTWKNGKYLFDGETASGVNAAEGDAASSYTFTNKGTYAGLQVKKGDNVFYFAKEMFVSSNNLADSYSYANIAPFRAFYATGNLSAGAKLMSFGIILGEGEGDVPSAIHAVDAAQFLDVDAPVYDLQGRKVATSYREAKSLKSGMYVVKGVKFIVK